MSSSEYREKSFEIWQLMSAGWERERQWMWDASRQVSEWLVDRLDPDSGETILELAAGTGETGFSIAPRLGEDGRLISTDFSPAMIEAARRRAHELGLRNVDLRVMDAERMDLPTDSVDGVVCRWGYMLMADPAAALAETRRVLRDGRLCLSVWGAPEKNPWAAVGGAALVAHGHMPSPEPGSPGIFALASDDRLRELLDQAAFSTIEMDEIRLDWHFDDIDDYWRFLEELAGGVALVLKTLSEAERAEVRRTIEQNAAEFRSNGGYAMPGAALNAVAR